MEVQRYRFGQLERRGLLVGLRGSQLGILCITGISALAALRTLSSGLALGVCLVIVVSGVISAFVPVGGRCVDEWLPVLSAWSLRTISGDRSFRSGLPTGGSTAPAIEQPSLPSALRDIVLLSHPIPSASSRLGVLKDRRAGTFTGVLAVRGRSFALLDAPEKARRLSSWAGILSGLARENSPINRIQWVERAVPDPGDDIGSYLKDNVAVPLDSPLARSYLEVVDEAGPTTQQHEVFVALQISAAKAGRAIKAAGGGDHGACEVLRRELTSLSTSLLGTDVAVEGALTPRLVAHAVRTAFDPDCRNNLATIASVDPDRRGTSIINAGPIATEETWTSYRTDNAFHATYWIAEWPRVDTDPDFLAPLLLRTERMRTVSLTMEPVSPLKAIRSVEAARPSASADEELRNRVGFAPTVRRSREQDSLADHERDLSDGHAFYRFSGFITVTARGSDELVAACGEIEEAAGRSFLDLRRLNGEQDRAFTYTLPLCRGLR